jgi:hypothetical protein
MRISYIGFREREACRTALDVVKFYMFSFHQYWKDSVFEDVNDSVFIVSGVKSV